MEGFILTIAGCPYAFTTNGITGITPTHADWASSWTMMENVLVNPTDYVQWNERTLPIEGDLEVDGITFKLLDKYVDSFALYDGTTFSGNILTELFTRGTARQNPYFIERSLVSVEQTPSTAYRNEISLFGEPTETSAEELTHYKNTWVSSSYDMTGFIGSNPRPIWIEDEAINVVAISGSLNNVLIVGQTIVGGESSAGRGYYGTENKYHRIKTAYKPEIYLKHPLIIKREMLLWRVDDVTDLSDTSIYPIWRGYAQSNPELSDDGSVFEIRAEHRWNVYKNETMDYAGFRYKFSIPTRTYSKSALHGIFISSLDNTLVIEPNLAVWQADSRLGYTNSFVEAFRGQGDFGGYNQPSLRQTVYELTNNSVFTYRVFPGDADPLNTVKLNIYANDAVLSPSQYNIGGRICGDTEFWSSQVSSPDQAQITSPVLPLVAIDFKQAAPGFYLKYSVVDVTALPVNYLRLFTAGAGTGTDSGAYQVVVSHVYTSEDKDKNMFVLSPLHAQPDAPGFIYGKMSKVNTDPSAPNIIQGSRQYIKEPLEFKSSLSVASNGTTIETIFKSILRPRSSTTVFNNINVNDFVTSNVEELNDWVSGIEPGYDINWLWKDKTKFFEFIQPYMKLYNYIVCLDGSKIKFKTYDPTRQVDHTFTTSDFLETPVNLATLPENLFNTVKFKAPNYDTEYVFNDELSKGRYKVGNTQEIELPASVGNITSPSDLIVYFEKVAKRFLSIWGYPQYVFKCKTSLSKINVEIGDIVKITDWLVPNFSTTSPVRGLVDRHGLVVERNVDLTTGIISFSIVYQEETDISYYSPCIRLSGLSNVGSQSFVTGSVDYIKPSNKLEPILNGFSGSMETSDYAGSNRYAYRDRHGLITPSLIEDGGVSAFTVGDRVELILRDSTTQAAFSGSGGVLLAIQNIDPVTRMVKLNQNITSSFVDYMTSGSIVDMRFANYNDCVSTQQTSFGFIGDFTFESLDNPPPTPPARRVVAASSLAP